MTLSKTEKMGKVTTTITITNQIDQTLAERGFIPAEQIRSITLHDVLVDTGATRLCLPKNIILDLGLPLQGEVDVKIATGLQKARIFKMLNLSVEGREGTFNCIELPEGSDPLLGLIPLEDLGLEPDLVNQKLRVLPVEGKDTYLMVL
ncbi:aspartyl protease family protein [Nostoc sp. FACHB-973]|uniref:Aspartyl protease family protein n=1 Tax=Desmonostoc muscorum LEGE 12446 TaxID=1828758 RepID=A0A8J7DCC0_DESMC|nr:aspartyl protease family protein [Desmonostoc muscorum]MBD2516555.1 aspartyl protease family protein [Nostoc sp. FACHB-973]MBX9255750.1 aspartyl protease family protein [Desmonostoc muscorum CCALA 125]MCF2147039.1 aspartyl protease family protein [Desmonostoc muscorum LEGE 12446]